MLCYPSSAYTCVQCNALFPQQCRLSQIVYLLTAATRKLNCFLSGWPEYVPCILQPCVACNVARLLVNLVSCNINFLVLVYTIELVCCVMLEVYPQYVCIALFHVLHCITVFFFITTITGYNNVTQLDLFIITFSATILLCVFRLP